MKRFVLAIALTGLMSMTVLAGDIPIKWGDGTAAATTNNVKHDQHVQQHFTRYGDTHCAWSEIDH